MTRAIVRIVACTAGVLAVAAAGVVPRAFGSEDEPGYTIVELRSLRGVENRANSINDLGVAAGFSDTADGSARRAMAWVLGEKIQLGSLGGPNSNVVWPGQPAIGLIVGIAQTHKPQTREDGWSCAAFFNGPASATYACQGFAWEWGRMRRLGALGGDNSFAAAANNRRQVVGWAETDTVVPEARCIGAADRNFLPVVWDLDENKTTALAPFGDDRSGAATGVNDRGQIVGISGDCDQAVGRHTARHAVMWENGGVRDLGDLNNPSWNTPIQINPRGDVIAGFVNSPGATAESPRLRAVAWTTRSDLCTKEAGKDICDLGTLDDGGTSQAWGVNDSGQVVGTACGGGVCKAFLFENGEMKDLNRLKGDYPHHLENAVDINAFGHISGRARRSDGVAVAFVAIPVREH